MEFHKDCHAEAVQIANTMQDPKNKQLYDTKTAADWKFFMDNMYPKSSSASDFVRDFEGTEFGYEVPFAKELFSDEPLPPHLITKKVEVESMFKKVQATASVIWHNRGNKQSRLLAIFLLSL